MTPLPPAVYVVLLSPVLALLVSFFVFHPFWPKRTHWPILASCAAMAAASCWLAWAVALGASWDGTLFHWLAIGPFAVDAGVRVDGLSASVLVMVSLVAALIHVYAVGYMRDDPGFSRFFMYFHFFFFSMVGLLLSNNYLQMYVFWEGVGLASFLLIGFWHDKESARAASWKAFLTNRIGDMGFLLAVFLMFLWAGTSRFAPLSVRAWELDPNLLSLIALLLFWGASAKSAQFPLHVWLPDAMEGPTPVSALMHAATMVTAGVFLMARSWPILQHTPEVRLWIACVGAGTALGAALMACMKKDLKRILAYSTVSHLGLMMLAIGCGSVYAAIFHLIMHGFFKALLFLCAGSVIHGLGAHGTVTVDEAGGLCSSLRVTSAAFLVGAMALAGLWPLSGFFSKDMILDAVFSGGMNALKPVALLIAAGSSFYIFRMFFLTFLGNRPEQSNPHAHEPGFWMQGPVLVLAGLSAVAGVVGNSGLLPHMLGVEMPEFSWRLAGAGLGMAGLGALGAWTVAMARPSWDWAWRRQRPGLELAFDGEFGWQAFASWVANSGARCAQWLAREWDLKRWDPWTETLADTCVGLGEGFSGLSRGLLNEYLWWMLAGSVLLTLAAVLCI